MQAVKIGTSLKSCSMIVKLREAIMAVRVERQESNSVLRLYLDNAPYGSNIVGIQSAALLYFRTPLHKLTSAQYALLAVLPNAPNLLKKTPPNYAPSEMRSCIKPTKSSS